MYSFIFRDLIADRRCLRRAAKRGRDIDKVIHRSAMSLKT
jgi:hypothetical protein